MSMRINGYLVGEGVDHQGVFLSTLNHAAYMAGKDNKVNPVATINPPMIAIAMGPQKTLLDSGIMASTAAAAVKIIGR